MYGEQPSVVVHEVRTAQQWSASQMGLLYLPGTPAGKPQGRVSDVSQMSLFGSTVAVGDGEWEPALCLIKIGTSRPITFLGPRVQN